MNRMRTERSLDNVWMLCDSRKEVGQGLSISGIKAKTSANWTWQEGDGVQRGCCSVILESRRRKYCPSHLSNFHETLISISGLIIAQHTS